MILDNLKCDINEISPNSFIPRGLLTKNDNLNNLFIPGIYQYSTDSIPDNCPFVNSGIVEVIKSDSRYIQRVTRYGTAGKSYERVYTNASDGWLAWTTRCAPVNLDKTVDYTVPAANTYSRVTTVTIPAKSFYCVTANPFYSNACPRGVRICSTNDEKNAMAWQEQAENSANSVSATLTGYTENALTLHIFAKWANANQNLLGIAGFYIPQ